MFDKIKGWIDDFWGKTKTTIVKGWRLWAAIDASAYRHTRVADVIFNSLQAHTYRAAKKAFKWEGNGDFLSKQKTVERLAQLCIVYGVEIGEYPGGDWDAADGDFVQWFQWGLVWAAEKAKNLENAPF